MARLKKYPTWRLTTKLKKAKRKDEFIPKSFAITGLEPTHSTENRLSALLKMLREGHAHERIRRTR